MLKSARGLWQSLNPVTPGCFTQPQGLPGYEGCMIISVFSSYAQPRATGAIALFAIGLSLGGCADMSDTMSTAFADPAKYDLYDCKQLETERKSLANRAAELQGLMAKAETGVAGPVVAELAYRNEYVSVRGQARFADEAWQRGNCYASAAPTPPPTNVRRTPPRPGSPVH